MTVAMAPAGPWEVGGHSVPCDGTATVGPANSAGVVAVVADDVGAAVAAAARAAAPGKGSARAPWRDLPRAKRMRWTKSSDASNGSHATAAAGRGSDSSSRLRRRACTASLTKGAARNRTGVAGGRNSAGSRQVHAALGERRRRQDGSAENLAPPWLALFGAGVVQGRLKWVRCGSVSGRRRGAAVEAAVADPSCWGLPGAEEPRGRRRRWRNRKSDELYDQGRRGLLRGVSALAQGGAGVCVLAGLAIAVACGINTGQSMARCRRGAEMAKPSSQSEKRVSRRVEGGWRRC